MPIETIQIRLHFKLMHTIILQLSLIEASYIDGDGASMAKMVQSQADSSLVASHLSPEKMVCWVMIERSGIFIYYGTKETRLSARSNS